MADSINNFPHDQADNRANELDSTSVTNIMADSVSDSISPDQADHQTHPEPLSTSFISAQTDGRGQVFEATHAAETVLGIPELQFLIVAEVPLDCRTSIRRVSKTWEAAVNKVGHTLEPLGYGTITSFEGVDADLLNLHCVPIYSATEESRRRVLKPNRRAGLDNVYLDKIGGYFANSHGIRQLALHLRYPKELIKHKIEFMTDPPVTQVLICGAHFSILRVSGGIRIRDLLECFEKFGPGCFQEDYLEFGRRTDRFDDEGWLIDARGNYV
jgi:hypothetical protein